jgi:eukaryotic-like serine/threonine-protein kinase
VPPIVPLSQTDTQREGAVVPATVRTTSDGMIPGYEIGPMLGRGAMGVVYKARQIKLNRLVAVKMMLGCALDDPTDKTRFHAEAVAVAQVQHPNVIQIYDVGESNGVPYLAVEYLDGGTLEQKMAGGRLSVREVIQLGYQIARGVGAAHTRGIVHRDLKPANILLNADGVPKVADFGLAKQLGAESNTMSGSILGTPQYMSPEQAAGQVRRLGPQADVYALGVILYEGLTGEVPHKGSSVIETLNQVRTAEPLRIRFRRAEVPPELEAIVLRCLHKVPAERYPTADALAEDLARVAKSWGKPKNGPATVNVYYVLTALTAVAALVVGGWLFGLFGDGKKSTPTTPPSAEPVDGIRFERPN